MMCNDRKHRHLIAGAGYYYIDNGDINDDDTDIGNTSRNNNRGQ